jgi:hypothetical protein
MSDALQTPYVNRASGAALAFATVTVLLVVVTLGTRFLVPATAIDADRATARYKALADVHAAEEAALNSPAWIDQDHGVVRLPVDLAIQLAAQKWQNPEQARADLIARGVKAAAPLPKTAPKPSAFE